MKKLSTRQISFLQAAGIVAYIVIFASTVQFLGPRFEAHKLSPLLSMALFLTAFVFSASVCAVIFFGYAAYSFFEGRKSEAVQLILWNLAWLAVFLFVFLTVLSVIALG